MRKFIQYFAAGAILAILVPGIVLAHGDNNSGDNEGGILGLRASFSANERADLDHDGDHDGNRGEARARLGVVTAVNVSGNTLTMRSKDGTIFTVNTADANIKSALNNAITLSGILVGDKVIVRGTISSTNSNVISASSVVDIPQNTHPARAKGTVTAVSGNSLTVQTNHDGVISNVTVNTNANTQITKSGGTAGTMADITAGAMVKVKGLWDELLNVLNAIKIRIK